MGPWAAVTRGTGAPYRGGTVVRYSRESCGSYCAGFLTVDADHFEMGADCRAGLEACYADQKAYYADQEAFYAALVAGCVDQEACHADWDDRVTCRADLIAFQDALVVSHAGQDGLGAFHAFAALEASHAALGACYAARKAYPGPLVFALDPTLAYRPLAF